MRATLLGRTKMLETFLQDSEQARGVDLSLVNDDGKTLLILFVQHVEGTALKVKYVFLIKTFYLLKIWFRLEAAQDVPKNNECKVQ